MRDLRHRRARVRASAAKELGLRGARESINPIMELTVDRDRSVRLAALGALLRLDPGRFAAAALELARRVNPDQAVADLDALITAEARLGNGETKAQ